MALFTRILATLGLRTGDDEHEQDGSDQAAGSDQAVGSDAARASAGEDAAPLASELPERDDAAERDPELEAQDDCGIFDFKRDIARFFTAEFRVEQGWNNPERRRQLFGEYEIRDIAHWYQVKATFARWLESDEGKATYPSSEALLEARMTTTQTVTIDELEQMIEDARRAKRS